MYEAFYGLREKPFSILPDPDLIYWGRMHSMAFTMLEFGVMNNAGFTSSEISSSKPPRPPPFEEDKSQYRPA